MIAKSWLLTIIVFGFACLLLGGIIGNFFIDSPNSVQFVDKVDLNNFKWDWYRALTLGTVGWVSIAFATFCGMYFKGGK